LSTVTSAVSLCFQQTEYGRWSNGGNPISKPPPGSDRPIKTRAATETTESLLPGTTWLLVKPPVCVVTGELISCRTENAPYLIAGPGGVCRSPPLSPSPAVHQARSQRSTASSITAGPVALPDLSEVPEIRLQEER